MEWRKQEAMLRHNPLMPVSSEELAEIYSNESHDFSQYEEAETFRWFIDLNGEIVGTVSLKNINRMMGFAEIGYGVDEKFFGQGIGTLSVSRLLEDTFSATPLRKIIAYVHDENTPSCRILEKLGFEREGVLREHYVINNQPVNELIYGLLKSEFRPAHETSREATDAKVWLDHFGSWRGSLGQLCHSLE